MKKALIIVESPAKIKTLRKFLGSDYLFESSIGHIRDLPPKKFGIDMENNFEPEYEILEGKKKVVTALKKAAKLAEVVYLSPDPDREGEAIAWHLSQILPKGTKFKRITFNEYTKDAVKAAIKAPREIDMDLVDAQQARRFLDRIVGYKISPILHQKIRRSMHTLSAGRVQSTALKVVVDREREIDAFNPIEYWNLAAHLLKGKENLVAALHSVNGDKVEKEPSEKKKVFIINKEKIAKKVKDALDKSTYTITKIDKKERTRKPAPPFITSTIQQEASRHHRFSSKKTMMLAQNLYEGIDVGAGSEGLITYMRTDSVRVSKEAQDICRAHIEIQYGKQYLPEKPISYGSKNAAQDAHEAIRPTNFENTPEKVKEFLSADQHKLYSLIWKRFFASQMKNAIYDTVSVNIDAIPKGHSDETIEHMMMRLSGSQIKFKGFLIAYQEKTDEEETPDKDTILPPLKVNEVLPHDKIDMIQSFTKPPGRFTEASFVKELERLGIGRPSTYSAIMSKIQSRAYTVKEKGALVPTDLGKIICQMLEENFENIMNIQFTADMEQTLDKIADHKNDWRAFLKKFWDKFKPEVDKAKKDAHVPKIPTDLDCPKCKTNKLAKVFANDKYFYGCSGYPDCDYRAPLEDEKEVDKSEYADDFDWEQKCPKCGGEMKTRTSRFGLFLGCAGYPKCKTIVNIPKKGEVILTDLPPCPAKGCDGNLAQRKSRYGKTFFSCSNFPDCNVIANSVDEVMEKYKDHEKTAYEKKKGAKGAGSRRSSPFLKVSKALTDIVGEKELTRGEITKKLWVYIKEHNLQDENNKRLIVPDAKMAKFFGNKEPLDMMQLARCISNNIVK
ncbi:MAG: DNA topoisomerase 1 [Chlamydiia bacterium]|nr:DNA topoisomerase 1 [Chlamydiia bacterium]MCH9618295.1 DNA topoisomerase 1 [Chlamydiia bacterium]MCH9624168.1 DNA topoisomerase 1 [Chlamydiia bacterium]